VAKTALADWEREPNTLTLLGRMGDLALGLVSAARKAWLDQDLAVAAGLKERDSILDACYRRLTEHPSPRAARGRRPLLSTPTPPDATWSASPTTR
jgi:hypothetical protein